MNEVPDTTDAAIVLPPLGTVRAVIAALEDAKIVAAVGGSGLLAAYGLVDRVRDWDVTSDGDPEAVQNALTRAGVSFIRDTSSDDGFATKAWIHVNGGDHEVDLLLGFAIRTDGEVVHLPTRVSRQWLGLPIADPVVWARAYRLLGRPDRASLLDGLLRGDAPR